MRPARQPLTEADRRVTPLLLDITNGGRIRAAADQVGSLDILINNAGISVQNDLSDRAALEQLLADNLTGTLGDALVFGREFTRYAAGRTPDRDDAHRLLPPAAHQGFRNILDDPSRC
jgi:NAD(P)-dependent dehydrogenase (short-subunit alcohol dehydrogenase family)